VAKTPVRNNVALTGPTAPWVLNKIRRVIERHEALTIDGWDDPTQASRYPAATRLALRRELFGERALKEVLATLIALAFQDIPRSASANWVVHQAEVISGVRVRLGTAIAGAIAAGYEPLRDTTGSGCGFRRRTIG
jgi:hypothetical protein